MLKYILVVIGSLFFINTAKSQLSDTTIFYLKNSNTARAIIVSSLDSADYFRIVLPPDSNDHLLNIKEFYKDGQIKFIGKAEPPDHISPKISMYTLLSGNCISYFPNGKKQYIVHYSRGQKDGDEYLFYPNGAIYCLMKYTLNKDDVTPSKVLNWECYDSKGSMICKDGNGQWIFYDGNFRATLKGEVKNGLVEGDWHGATMFADSIKYTYTFKNGAFISGKGFDKNGNAYPFKEDLEQADYENSPVDFLDMIYKHLIIPKNSDGTKMLLDTVHVSFVVEKDGKLSHLDVLGDTNPTLKAALIAALMKCPAWTPRKSYGVPLRTQIIFPLKKTKGDFRDVTYLVTVLDD